MKPLSRAIEFVVRLVAWLYSGIFRSRFAAWGRHSRLGLGAKLDGPEFVRVGDNVTIGSHVWLNAKDDRGDGQATLAIGDGTYIGRFVQINAWQSVEIGHSVLVADRVMITDADHDFQDLELPIRQQGDSFRGPVVLRDGCWIGIGAVILPGVTVGRNAIVGANAVVTRDVPDRAVAAGVPARIIKQLQTGTEARVEANS
jgi:acetyltransferase-like isoleucine patch superfamily enzyme